MLQGSPLVIESQHSINVSSGTSEMSLSPNAISINTTNFTVFAQTSPKLPLLSASNGRVEVSAETLEVKGSLGVAIEGGVETSSLCSVEGVGLGVESRAGRMELVGGEGVSVEGGVLGGVTVTSNKDLTLSSQSGAVRR